MNYQGRRFSQKGHLCVDGCPSDETAPRNCNRSLIKHGTLHFEPCEFLCSFAGTEALSWASLKGGPHANLNASSSNTKSKFKKESPQKPPLLGAPC